MNKQAIIFLSLFSLTLVLSVYYITLPQDLLNNNEIVAQTNNEVVDFDQLWLSLEEKHTNAINENSLIVSSSSVTENDKKVALESIENTKQIQLTEKNLAKVVKENGYENVYIEINDNICKVIVKSEDNSPSNAAKIISIIIKETSAKYLPDVKFVS